MSATVHAGEKGVDFSFARPPAEKLLELGYTFVVGYISVPPASPAKNITRAQCDYYRAAGLKVLLVWEMSASRANLGAAYGSIDGSAAKTLAGERGYPTDVPVIIADDTDTTGVVAKVWAALKRLFSGGNIDAHEDYMFAALGSIAPYQIGEYGDCDILERTIGLWKIGWVPNAWGWSARSRAAADARAKALGAHVLQRKGFWIDDTWAVDPNEAIADFPAWGSTSLSSAVIPPTSSTGDDDMLRLLVLNDSPARLFAMCDSAGRALRCEWTGPGDENGSNPRIEFYRNAHPAGGVPFEMGMATGSLINISLDGVLPPTLTAEMFANPDEITARVTSGTVDNVARKGMGDLNSSVATLGQEIGDIKAAARQMGS